MNELEREKLDKLENLLIIGFTRLGLSEKGEPVNGIFTRMQKIEKELSNIKESLHGNVTIHTLKAWVLGMSSLFGALMFLGGIFIKIIN